MNHRGTGEHAKGFQHTLGGRIAHVGAMEEDELEWSWTIVEVGSGLDGRAQVVKNEGSHNGKAGHENEPFAMRYG